MFYILSFIRGSFRLRKEVELANVDFRRSYMTACYFSVDFYLNKENI